MVEEEMRRTESRPYRENEGIASSWKHAGSTRQRTNEEGMRVTIRIIQRSDVYEREQISGKHVCQRTSFGHRTKKKQKNTTKNINGTDVTTTKRLNRKGGGGGG